MKWTERWIARAQRKADLRDERFRRHEEGVRAGTEQPGFLERLGSLIPLDQPFQPRHVNADFPLDARPDEASLRLAGAWLTWVGHGSVCGPDGVVVSIWIRSAGQDLTYHHTADDQGWRRRRERAVGHSDYTVCVRRMPAGPVEIIRSFAAENSARWYAVGLARQVREVGITGLRPSDLPVGPGPTVGLYDIVADGILGIGLGAGRGLAWLPRRARARWRRVRTGRR